MPVWLQVAVEYYSSAGFSPRLIESFTQDCCLLSCAYIPSCVTSNPKVINFVRNEESSDFFFVPGLPASLSAIYVIEVYGAK